MMFMAFMFMYLYFLYSNFYGNVYKNTYFISTMKIITGRFLAFYYTDRKYFLCINESNNPRKSS